MKSFTVRFFGLIPLLILMNFFLPGCLPSNTPKQVVNPVTPEKKNPAASQTQTTPIITPAPTIDYGDQYNAIQLAWFYKPPASRDLASISSNYSFFILTRKDEQERDAFRAQIGQNPILQYILFQEIQNPGSCKKTPNHNQVAEKPGDFCLLDQQHPDWFLKGLFDNNLANDNGYRIMDPGNPAWRNYWLERVRISQEQLGWQGVFLDNVEASLEKRIQYGGIPKKYQDDAGYQAAIEENLRFIYSSYFKPKGRPLFANIISLKDPSVWYRYIKYLDGAMIENFAVGWNNKYATKSTWEMQMDIAEKTQAMGKMMLLVSQGDEFDGGRQVFSLASYLLINNGKAYFRYTNSDHYADNWVYDNYHLKLGKPSGQRYQDGENWKRDFEGGTVWVNPTEHTASIDVK